MLHRSSFREVTGTAHLLSCPPQRAGRLLLAPKSGPALGTLRVIIAILATGRGFRVASRWLPWYLRVRAGPVSLSPGTRSGARGGRVGVASCGEEPVLSRKAGPQMWVGLLAR